MAPDIEDEDNPFIFIPSENLDNHDTEASDSLDYEADMKNPTDL